MTATGSVVVCGHPKMLVATLGLLAQMAAVPADAGTDARLLRHARSAQAEFERTRRANLPRKPDPGGSRPCDAQVGRYCYWYDSTHEEPDPEPLRIVAGRARLLMTLDSAAAAAPDDGWIAGQRVRYLIEADRLEDALGAATSCRAAPWWCASLEGLVHQVAQRYTEADSMFSRALRGMPPDQRCHWFDLRDIIDRRWVGAFRDASCESRRELAERVFALGQPLWMSGGSDLATEHFARLTMALIREHSAHAYENRFADDNRELLVRYGWPEWFTRHEPLVSAYPTVWITGHERAPSFYFLPDVRTLARAWPDTTSWNLRDPRAPTRYAPRHIRRMTELPHQLARFPRGDSLLIVASIAPSDASLAHDEIRSALATWLPGGGVRVIARGRGRALAGVAPAESLVVSVEALGDSTRVAARARYVLSPLACPAWCLSDLLLVDPTRVDSTAGPIEAAQAARASSRVEDGALLGVYFELASDPRATSATPVTFALSVTPIRVGTVRRIAARLRLADYPGAVRMRWQAIVDASGQRGRVVAIHIPAAARGNYRVQLTVTPRGAEPVRATRDIEVGH